MTTGWLMQRNIPALLPPLHTLVEERAGRGGSHYFNEAFLNRV
jgi:hypothetical protein